MKKLRATWDGDVLGLCLSLSDLPKGTKIKTCPECGKQPTSFNYFASKGVEFNCGIEHKYSA